MKLFRTLCSSDLRWYTATIEHGSRQTKVLG